MIKRLSDFLAGLPMTIAAGVFLLLDLIPHLMEEFGGALMHNAGSCFVVLIAALLYDRKFE